MIARPFLYLLPLTAALSASAQTPAFPGALGFGANATGGRGASVYHVTNLNDSGAGSFRDAVSTAGRTVVFDVGGYITLNSECGVKSNITIAGQTAPGGGIGIRGAEVTFGNQSNIICRFVRCRPGGDSNTTDNGLSLYQAKNVIVDHCSVGFAKWNDIDAVSEDWQNKPVKDISVTHCIIANPIGQQFGAHTECVEGTWFWLGNIFANGHNRQPLAKIHTVFINNTIYNYSAAYTTHTSTAFKHDIVNNYFIGGPASAGTDNTWFQVDKNQSIYYAGNYKDRDRDNALDGTVTTPYWYQGPGTVLAAPWSPLTAAAPTLTAAQAVVRNNSEAGPLPHDELDVLVINQVKTLGLGSTGTGAGTAGPGGGLYTSQTQTGLADDGYGVITGGTAPVDADRDGMPDDWETVKGLNPTNANDGKTIQVSGYSNLEDYLNWLALPHAFVAKNTPSLPTGVTLDLLPYISGFPAGTPVTLSAITGGNATIANGVVTFTPTVNTSGLGGFTFSATSGGYTFTKTAGILISPNPSPKTLRWKGDGTANAWNTTTTNWINAGTGAQIAFSNGDRVTLDDTGSNTPALTLTGTLAPGYMEKSSGSKTYTLGGAGSLSGAMALSVSGATLTLQNTAANTYSGGTFIEDSTVILGGNATLGSGPVTFSGNSTLASSYAAGTTLNLGGSMFIVGADDAAAIVCSPRMALGGCQSGGTVTVYVKGTAGGTGGDYFNGPWAGFTGKLNLANSVANAQCDLNINGGGFDNFGGTALNLDVRMQSRHNSGGNTIAIGALTGFGSLAGSSYAGGATYEIGARNEDCTFSGTISDGVAPTTVTKVGSAYLYLRGPHTNTGPTNVFSGTLYTHGDFAGLINVTGGSLSPRGPVDGTGQVRANEGLTLDDGTLSMDLSSSPSGNNDKVTCPTGTTLTLNGTNTFRIKFANGYLTEGTYPLVDGNATLVREAGVVLNYTSPLPAGSRQTMAVVRNSSTTPVPAYVNLVVTGNVADLTWTGTNGGIWDLSTTQSWSSTAATNPGLFYNFDAVNFTDSTSAGTVTVNGTVSPRAINVTASTTAYNFTGSGVIAGSTVLTKSGGGTLTLSGTAAHTFTGGTLLQSGTLMLDTASATPLGTGEVTVSGGILHLGAARSLPNSVLFSGTAAVAGSSGNVSLVSDPANAMSSTGAATVNFSIPSGICTIQGPMNEFTGTLDMGTSNGMLRLNGTANANFGSAAAHFHLGTGFATLANRNGGVTIELGALSGGFDTKLQGRQSGTGTTVTNYLIGALNTDTTFAGRINTGGDSAVNITKLGTGTWTLSGSSIFSGDLTVQSGQVKVTGSISHSGDVTVRSGATLTITDGSISTDRMEIEAGATVDVCGIIAGDIVNYGTLRVTCPGQIILNGSLENHGLVIATGGSRIHFNGAVENSGTLDLMGSPATTLPANFTNNGILLDASTVKVQSVTRAGTTVTLTMQTHPGHTYELQSSPALGDPWLPVTANVTVQTSPAGLRTWIVTGVSASRIFLRIGVGP